MALLGILVIAAFLRCYDLALMPLSHDEVTWHLWSVNNFDKFLGIPVSCFHGYIQPAFSYLIVFSKHLFFSPEYIVRFPAAAIGLTTIIATYSLGKRIFGEATGLISAGLLCFLQWHVIQSRVGVSLILTPFFGCLIFLVLFNSVHKKSNKWFLWSCFLLGAALFYTYQASLLFLPVFLCSVLWLKKELSWLRANDIMCSGIIYYCSFSFFIFIFYR
ncbi:MAG: glycosyltransferase family 39 protein [Candidatus Omnitrophica bacterium]|nr:glycosyltransferase family 39 protein [Candidatus Omnitrophota bacterium]